MKIKSLYIKAFRGIPNELTMNFVDKNGKIVSTIISGDNGSGKSSIVDAIEYNLQGRISRNKLITSSDSRFPISYKYKPYIGCWTKVTLDNGKENERSITVDFDGKKTHIRSNDKIIIKDFSFTPIALRRSDILSFSIIPKDKRQILFFSFLYKPFTKIEDVITHPIYWEGDEYIKSMKDEYIELKHKRQDIIEDIASFFNVKVDEIPYGYKDKFTKYINLKLNIRNGLVNISKIDKKLLNIISLTNEVQELTDEIKNLKEKVERELNPEVYGVKVQERREHNALFISKASEFLTKSFIEISNLDYIQDIKLNLGGYTSASLDVLIHLKNGNRSTPNKLFSEANYDLLVLLLYISLIRAGAELGQAKVMILDDVLQSVDSVIRAKFMDYILRECKDWQFIITCHDDLWLNQLRYLFNKNGSPFMEYKLSNWTFENGPKVYQVKENGEDTSLKEALNTNNKQIIASQSGLFLEKMCQKLSISLPISVARKIDNKYTIGELWPGIKKALLKIDELKILISDIDRELMARNMMGCHANEWAESMSEQEVVSFANNVQLLYSKVFCTKCCNWITSDNLVGNYLAECKCREIQYTKKQ